MQISCEVNGRNQKPIALSPIMKRRPSFRPPTFTKWILDLNRGLQPEMLEELISLATMLDDVTLNPDVTDTIRWRFEASGEYTARSAYRIQFEGSTISVTAPLIYLGWLGTWQVSVFGLLQ